ncbi:MAG TPA: oxalate/formate MFS antiporter [Magnetospirillaceae bacterium]|jgi:OFA family oxalate/formate antiporter-like MFS transporter
MADVGEGQPTASTRRWLQLVFGVVCMVMIANLQYGWNLFVKPIQAAHHWDLASIQVAFSIFVLTETWLVPVEGWFVDKFGPRVVVAIGGVLVAIAWAINSIADSLPVLYGAAVISGIGAGAVYGTCVGNALKWFPDRRGLAAGLTAAGFGAGAAATVVPIREVIQASGYQSAFLWFGLGQGAIILIVSRILKAPPRSTPIKPRRAQTVRDFTFGEMLRTPLFWLLYVMFVLVAAGGLMVTAQLATIASDYGVAGKQIGVFGASITTLTLALTINNILNGLARPFFGWVSDQIGREETMALVFALGAASIWGLGAVGGEPVMFVLLSGAVYFTWGEIYSLFPATCTDSFGARYATTNAGVLYTAKGTAALLVPVANTVMKATGDWHDVFNAGAVMDILAAILAIGLLKPLRRIHATTAATTPVPETP